MRDLSFSFIVPVFNRPAEIEKLLASISVLDYNTAFEVVVVEDGSTITCEDICARFRESVSINYLFKPNSGPGDSRNYGMQHAKGNYYIVLDSDCIIPKDYLKIVEESLTKDFVDCYGGPDAAHENFSDLQKAINYSMTSFFTTGGIRGGTEQLNKFQPRSFNMGISKEAFVATGGFGKIHPGEDPDLSIRLWNAGFDTKLIKEAYVYHERRISWKLFYKQVNKFGKVRVILNKWHPDTAKMTYWFPTLFMSGLLLSVLLLFFGIVFPLWIYVIYFLIILVDSTVKNGLKIGVMSVWAALLQFCGYGYGFIKSFYHIKLLGAHEKTAFPKLFFK